ncbi:MAG: cyclohydrolase [Actinomycetota bacterium]|nr:cyclohydrolase [Actinomycetota bacterium]MEA2487101.1 cyclohydrolase [Actinomycetota bacterium]
MSSGTVTPLRPLDPDVPRAEAAVAELLDALGIDIAERGLEDTPGRVARMYRELLMKRPFNATTFPNTDGYDELVIAKSIPFSSLCEHHLLPFHGVAHVGYIPNESIVGLSKLARIVEHYARDLQVQERMTKQIATWLESNLDPKGVGVVLEAEHQCMTIRGVQAAGSKTITSAMTGLLRSDMKTREEFLALANKQ